MIKKILRHKDFLSIAVILFSILLFFYPFFLQGKLPIPGDTIVGLYHPFRDLYSDTNPNGLPYKNFLLTDPVRQQYVWKELVVSMLSKGQFPIWNPYEMAGKPFLANFQSGVFYPLNLVLFIQPFATAWSYFIVLQSVLAGIFMYCYLRHLRMSHPARVLGTLSWVFSGFLVAWLEWGVIVHTILWLPLILLSVHNLFECKRKRWELTWFCVLLLSCSFSFFAGHLQTFFYLFLFTVCYSFALWSTGKRSLWKLFSLLTFFILFVTLTSIQWVPTLQFIELSARSSDQGIATAGWFIPYQNLVQFIIPDFFGNPATLNYYGVWNYSEFIGYIGLGAFILALYAIIVRRDKKSLFFTVVIMVCIILSTQNYLSELPFVLKVPFISTAQPTRMLSLICFSLAVLASLGFDYFLKHKKQIFVPLVIVGIVITICWVLVFSMSHLFPDTVAILVTKSNLRFPTILFVLFSVLFLGYSRIKNKTVLKIIIVLIIFLSLVDLLRFGFKYTPFVDKKYLFPQTKTTEYLMSQTGLFRIAATDSRIFPPNFSTHYNLQSVEGYDPLYLKSYGSMIAANEREDHSVAEPFGFNRIITPRNINSPFLDFLNVKYVLSFDELDPAKFKKVLTEGLTKTYENKNVLPRVYFVENIGRANTQSGVAELLSKTDLSNTAIVIDKEILKSYTKGNAKVTRYAPNEVVINTTNVGDGFLVFSDTYYPSFRATIDGRDTKIYQVNGAFRGVIVPKGVHIVKFVGGLF